MKQKTHSGASKRFRVTGTGKILHRRANRNHLNEHKPSQRMRRLWREGQLAPEDTKRVRKMLGI